jgi:hypothetical protein
MKYRAILPFALLLGACVVDVPPPAIPVVEILGKTCTETPSRAMPVTLTPKRKAATNNVVSVVGPTTPCVNRGGKASNYVVFELPSAPQNHTITVGGGKETLRAFAPSVSVLDAAGTVIRSFPKDRLTNFGTTFSVQFRPSAEARYILVQSEPELVGTVVSAFETNIATTSTSVYNASGYVGTSSMTFGSEGGTARGFSHEGNVVVYIQAVTGKIGLPDEK